MKKDNIQGSLILLVTATIWGFAFAFQSAGMEYVGPFTFMVLRNIIGTIVLLPLAIVNKEKSESTKTLVFGGIICGIALGTAGSLQQYGIVYTTAGKAGFITALYIIMIPIASGIFMKQKCPKNVYPAVALAIIGLYFLCINGEFIISRGDFFEFMCAVVFTVQILAVAHFSSRVNVFKFACIEFVAAGCTALIPAVLTETFSFSMLRGGWVSVLYTGILSSGAGYTLQIIGQRKLNPTVAAIIMSLESCVSVIGGWLILGQALTAREIIGCVIMFAAIILAQLPEGFIRKILRSGNTRD